MENMAPLPAPPIPYVTTLKRGRDPASDLAAGEPLAKRAAVAAPGDVIFRVVVPARHIGRVIGKQGARVQQVRASTGATIKIADASVPREDRVIIISSKEELNVVSSAETALLAVAKLILTENEGNIQAEVTAGGTVVVNTVRLLITGSQAGGLIGASGQNIALIRNSSGATVNVLAQNQLPPCASVQDSDRVVQVSGDVPEVLNALEKIGCKLRENPPKEVITIKPRQQPQYSYGFPFLNLPPYVPPYMPPGPPPSVDHVTSEMIIMEKLVGGLIGKNGYNISKMRAESGANIKISGTKGGGEQRLIQFSGSALQVSLARTMVENFIFSQLQSQIPFRQ